MTATTYAAQLANVQAAIEAIETGAQAYSVAGGRSKTAADLDTLYRREKYLRRMAQRETDGGIRVTAATPVDA